MTTAAIYCRISLDLSGDRLGVSRQEFECRELAERLGLDVGAVFTDNDISAYRGARRPAWEELNSRIAAGEFEVLISWHPDRLTRSPIQLEGLVDLLETTKTKVFTVTAGEYDLGTATGRMCARVVGAVARHESERHGERARARARQIAMTGRAWGKGRRPFGFEPDGVQHRPSEVRAIRRAARELLAGRLMKDVMRSMPPSPQIGGPWRAESFRRMLQAERMIGLRTYKGEVVAVGNWKPVLDRATWDALCALFESRKVGRPNVKRVYLLSTIATDYKGSKLHGSTRNGLRRYESDRGENGEPGITIRADEVDAIVLNAVRVQQRFQRPGEEWDVVSLHQRRQLVRNALESIVILPWLSDAGVKRQLPERVVITPR